jgi:hypothetical protein
MYIRCTHTGLYADGRANNNSVLIPDLDVGYEFQTRKVPCYIPRYADPVAKTGYGHIDIPASSRSMLSYDNGAIKKWMESGVITAEFVTGSNPATVLWAPYWQYETMGEMPHGSVSTWREAVAAVNASDAPEKTIYILDIYPGLNDFHIPGGNWDLTNTTLVGVHSGGFGFTDFTTYTYRTNVSCMQRLGPWSPNLHINGDPAYGVLTGLNGYVVTMKVNGFPFDPIYSDAKNLIGQTIKFQWSDYSENNGEFPVVEVVDASTIRFRNSDAIIDPNDTGLWWEISTPVYLRGFPD